jgi:hypothetical protein
MKQGVDMTRIGRIDAIMFVVPVAVMSVALPPSILTRALDVSVERSTLAAKIVQYKT